ncbi:MAG TPA: PIN domain-containing protein [Thermoanaerobaculia bacterium]|nr:PIN domain-containing protein [Thermoanaerobaculia bacterium]
MTATVFVDTNVLVYARDSSEPDKQKQASVWMTDLWRTRRGRISQQVLQEYYVTVTRKLRPGLLPKAAREDVRALFAWNPVPTDVALLDRAWFIEDAYRLSFWDAMIVAAARIARAGILLTEDLQEGADLDGVMVVNPFRRCPDGEMIHD